MKPTVSGAAPGVAAAGVAAAVVVVVGFSVCLQAARQATASNKPLNSRRREGRAVASEEEGAKVGEEESACK